MVIPDILEHLASIGGADRGLADRLARLRQLLTNPQMSGSRPNSLAAERIGLALDEPASAIPAIQAALNRPTSDGDPILPDRENLDRLRITALEEALAWVIEELDRLSKPNTTSRPTGFAVHTTTTTN